jgi:hypothetical protein
MQKLIKYILILMLVLVGFISCEKDDTVKPQENELKLDLKTVSPMDVAKTFEGGNKRRSEQSWITPYFEYNHSIPFTNTDAQITVTPVITSVSNAYSRLFSIEINGSLESVVYHMIPSKQSSPNSFWGKAIITDLSGDLLSAFDVEDNLYTGYYDIVNHPETINILETNSRLSQINGGGDDSSSGSGSNNDNSDNPCDDCAMEFNLDEVVVNAPGNGGLSTGIIILFVPELFPNDDEDGGISPIPDSAPWEPTASAGNTNSNSCPRGKIKDDNEDCVDPPEGCDELNGYYYNEIGDCVKDPCAEINVLLDDSAYKAKLAELNTQGNTNNANEKGYGYHKDNGFLQLQTASDGHSVSYAGFDLNKITGFVHTHPCGQVDIGTGSSTTLVSSIPMPSPTDILAFRRLLSRALEKRRHLQDIYMTVISCHGIFDLKYPGDGSNLRNWNMNEDDYIDYFKDEDNPVLAFKKYLDEVVNQHGNGFELYEYVKDETTNEYEAIQKEVNSDADEIVSINDCN